MDGEWSAEQGIYSPPHDGNFTTPSPHACLDEEWGIYDDDLAAGEPVLDEAPCHSAANGAVSELVEDLGLFWISKYNAPQCRAVKRTVRCENAVAKLLDQGLECGLAGFDYLASQQVKVDDWNIGGMLCNQIGDSRLAFCLWHGCDLNVSRPATQKGLMCGAARGVDSPEAIPPVRPTTGRDESSTRSDMPSALRMRHGSPSMMGCEWSPGFVIVM